MNIDPYLGIEWPLVLEVQLSNISWILVDNINWILDDWCTCLSHRLKHNLVLPKYNISNSVLYDEYLFLYVSYESHPYVEGTHLVSCTTINLTISSHRVTWFVHKYMLRFVFDSEYKVHLGLKIQIHRNQIWSANYRYRNIISTHTNGYVMLGLCINHELQALTISPPYGFEKSIMLS